MSIMQDAIDNFPEPIVAIAIIGENGKERIWQAGVTRHQAGCEWVAKHLYACAVMALKNEADTGHG